MTKENNICPSCSEEVNKDTELNCSHCGKLLHEDRYKCPECNSTRFRNIGSRVIRITCAVLFSIIIFAILTRFTDIHQFIEPHILETLALLFTILLVFFAALFEKNKCKECGFSWTPKTIRTRSLSDSRFNEYAKTACIIIFVAVLLGGGFLASQIEPPPSPEEHLSNLTGSLEVSRQELKDPFSEKGYRFAKGDDQFGYTNYVGEKNEKSAVQVLGPEEDLVQASIIMRVPLEGTPDKEDIADMISFLRIVAPDWQESDKWLAEAVRDIEDEGVITVQYYDIIIMLQDSEEYDVVILTARPSE